MPNPNNNAAPSPLQNHDENPAQLLDSEEENEELNPSTSNEKFGASSKNLILKTIKNLTKEFIDNHLLVAEVQNRNLVVLSQLALLYNKLNLLNYAASSELDASQVIAILANLKNFQFQNPLNQNLNCSNLGNEPIQPFIASSGPAFNNIAQASSSMNGKGGVLISDVNHSITNTNSSSSKSVNDASLSTGNQSASEDNLHITSTILSSVAMPSQNPPNVNLPLNELGIIHPVGSFRQTIASNTCTSNIGK